MCFKALIQDIQPQRQNVVKRIQLVEYQTLQTNLLSIKLKDKF